MVPLFRISIFSFIRILKMKDYLVFRNIGFSRAVFQEHNGCKTVHYAPWTRLVLSFVWEMNVYVVIEQ